MNLYKVTFYVPESHLESVKAAMFEAGGGRIGDYDQCAWQVKGMGQFRPLENSQAFIGEINQLETIEEYRVEMVCDPVFVQEVVRALEASHPYEEPAYDVVKTVTL